MLLSQYLNITGDRCKTAKAFVFIDVQVQRTLRYSAHTRKAWLIQMILCLGVGKSVTLPASMQTTCKPCDGKEYDLPEGAHIGYHSIHLESEGILIA